MFSCLSKLESASIKRCLPGRYSAKGPSFADRQLALSPIFDLFQYSHVEPRIWRSFELDQAYHARLPKAKLKAIRPHFQHIISIRSIGYTSRQECDIIKECPFVQNLHLTLNECGPRFSYKYLESFFVHMSHLTTLHIKIHMFGFNLAMLWSLSRARNLTSLHLHGVGEGGLLRKRDGIPFVLKKHTLEDFLAVVDCCQHVGSIWLEESFMDPSYMQNDGPPVYTIKEKRFRHFDSSPESPQKAIEQSRSWCLGSSPSTSSVAVNGLPLPSPALSLGSLQITPPVSASAVRFLRLETRDMDGPVFMSLTKKFPLLEEFIFTTSGSAPAGWTPISLDSWKDFTVWCARLRVLRIYGVGCPTPPAFLPPTSILLSLSPNLETIHFDQLRFSSEPPLLDFMDESDQTKRSPQLRQFALTRCQFHNPLEVLVAVMTRYPGLVCITIGQDQHGKRDQGHSRPQVRPRLFSLPWLCLDTLTRMDIACTPITDQDEFVWFFRQMQQLRRLQRLTIASQHLTNAVTYSTELRSGSEELSSTDLSSSRRFFFLPAVRSLCIRDRTIGNYGTRLPRDTFSYDQAAFVMESVPLLTRLETTLAVPDHDRPRLRAAYPQLQIYSE